MWMATTDFLRSEVARLETLIESLDREDAVTLKLELSDLREELHAIEKKLWTQLSK